MTTTVTVGVGGHSDREHAVLSASGAHRWMHCPPSALIEARLPDDTTPAAVEGTRAHELAEYKLRTRLGQSATMPEGALDDADMDRHTDAYVDYVAGLAGPKAVTMVETRVDFDHLVPGGFGTVDAIVLDGDQVHVIDFKYGAGVAVSAEDNPQLRCYALGVLHLLDGVDEVHQVSMHIVQPRRESTSRETLTADQLDQWGREVLAPAARLAAHGEGGFAAGEWCRFCKLAGTCRERAKENLAIARREFQPPAELTDAEVSEVLTRAPELKKWLADLEKHATKAAVAGHTYPGLKLVAGRTNRRITNPQAAIHAARAAGFDDGDLFETRLLGITALEKNLGRARFNDVLGEYVTKPAGKPVIAPASDKRAEWAPPTANDDFTTTD